MEVTVFEITSAVATNPSEYTIPMITTIISVLCILIGYAFSTGLINFPTMKRSARFMIFSCGLLMAAIVFVIGKSIAQEYTPQNYESHMTCKYGLMNGNEVIEYYTLIPRDTKKFCSRPGTKVTRIKTPEYTKFFVEFEIPR